jgi:hypothetical protein
MEARKRRNPGTTSPSDACREAGRRFRPSLKSFDLLGSFCAAGRRSLGPGSITEWAPIDFVGFSSNGFVLPIWPLRLSRFADMPTVHVSPLRPQDVDARMRGHDENRYAVKP